MKKLLFIILLTASIPSYTQSLYPFPRGGKWGYINGAGTVVVKPIYESAGYFVDGMGKVALITDRDEYLYGFVTANGRETIPPKFTSVSDFNEGLARVLIRGRYTYLLKNGTVITANAFDEIYPATNGMSLFKQDGLYGYAGPDGKVVIKPIFTRAYDFSDNGRAIVSTNEGRKITYGYINKTGKFVVEPIYDGVKHFKKGFSAVSEGRKWYVIDENGNFVSDQSFEKVGEFSDGLINIKVRGKWGYINSAGETIIPEQYEIADKFSNGLAVVGDGTFYGYINKNGEQVAPYNFTRVTRFDGRLARVSKISENGFMNGTGKYNLTDKIASIGSFYEGRARMRTGSFYGYYSQDAKLAIKPKYIYASDFKGELAVTVHPVAGGYRTSYINKSGTTVKYWDTIAKSVLQNKDVFYTVAYPNLPFYRESDPNSRVIIRVNYGGEFEKSPQRVATPIIGHGLNGLLYSAEHYARPGYVFSEAISIFPPPKIGMGITTYFREKFGIVSETGSPVAYDPMNATFFNGATLKRSSSRTSVADEYFVPFMKVSESLFLFAAALGNPISEYPERGGTLPNYFSRTTTARFNGSRNREDVPTSYSVTVGRENIAVKKENFGITLTHTYPKPDLTGIREAVSDPIFVTDPRDVPKVMPETNVNIIDFISTNTLQTNIIIETTSETNTINAE